MNRKPYSSQLECETNPKLLTVIHKSCTRHVTMEQKATLKALPHVAVNEVFVLCFLRFLL